MKDLFLVLNPKLPKCIVASELLIKLHFFSPKNIFRNGWKNLCKLVSISMKSPVSEVFTG